MVNSEVKFGNESQLPLLAARLGNRLTGESFHQRLVICEEGERTPFEKITVVEKGGVNSLELSVKCGIPLLRRGEFGGEKRKWLPHSMDLLLNDSIKMAIGGICGEGDWSSGVRMEEKSSPTPRRPGAARAGRCPWEHRSVASGS